MAGTTRSLAADTTPICDTSSVRCAPLSIREGGSGVGVISWLQNRKLLMRAVSTAVAEANFLWHVQKGVLEERL